MSPLFAHLNREQAHTYSLVLASTGIPHTVLYSGKHWRIHVSSDHRRPAQRAIALYLQENPNFSEHARPVSEPRPRSFSAFFAAALLAAVHMAVGAGPQRRTVVEAFGADAHQIMSGQLYRSVTALLLHGDASHLIANMAGTILFGTFAAILYGWGVAWLLIALAGAQGNFLTAWWYGRNHLSVGASTAVFAALGLCVALTFWKHRNDHTRRLRAWLPLAGGLALVGWLGTSPQADLMAHLLGFASGLLYGMLYARAGGRVYGWPIQAAALLLVAAGISASWLWGLYVNE